MLPDGKFKKLRKRKTFGVFLYSKLAPLKQHAVGNIFRGERFGYKIVKTVTLFIGKEFSLDGNVEETLFEFWSEMFVGD